MEALRTIAEIFVGTWLLTGSLHERAEVTEFHDAGRREAEIAAWLAGDSHQRLHELAPAHGLTLVVAADGHFAETVAGRPDTYWYDADGVEEMHHPTPFDGRTVERASRIYLQPDEREIRVERAAQYPGVALRVDDGDTMITDRIERIGAALVRTVSVVTDEAYLSRLTLTYRKSGE